LNWNKDSFIFTVDGKIINEILIPDGGFTELGGFSSDIYKNGNKDAPFDSRVRKDVLRMEYSDIVQKN